MSIKINESRQYVKIKPWWFRLVPGLWGNYANTIYPWIYVPNDVFVDLKKEKPKRTTIATLIHEEVHLKRQKEFGIMWYGIKYVFSCSFRFEEELLAIAPQIAYLKQWGIGFDIEARARALSSSMYLWCSSYEEARRRLGEIVILD